MRSSLPTRVLDPGGRDGCRAPIPWTASSDHGWATADPWLPWPPGADGPSNVAAQADDSTSMLSLYRAVLAERRSSEALRLGTFEWIDSDDHVVAFVRTAGADRKIVLVNFADEARPAPAGLEGTVVLTSDGGRFDGTQLAPCQAVILG